MKVICPNRTDNCDDGWNSSFTRSCIHKTPHECNKDSHYCLTTSRAKGIGKENCSVICKSVFGEIFKTIIKEEENK